MKMLKLAIVLLATFLFEVSAFPKRIQVVAVKTNKNRVHCAGFYTPISGPGGYQHYKDYESEEGICTIRWDGKWILKEGDDVLYTSETVASSPDFAGTDWKGKKGLPAIKVQIVQYTRIEVMSKGKSDPSLDFPDILGFYDLTDHFKNGMQQFERKLDKHGGPLSNHTNKIVISLHDDGGDGKSMKWKIFDEQEGEALAIFDQSGERKKLKEERKKKKDSQVVNDGLEDFWPPFKSSTGWTMPGMADDYDLNLNIELDCGMRQEVAKMNKKLIDLQREVDGVQENVRRTISSNDELKEQLDRLAEKKKELTAQINAVGIGGVYVEDNPTTVQLEATLKDVQERHEQTLALIAANDKARLEKESEGEALRISILDQISEGALRDMEALNEMREMFTGNGSDISLERYGEMVQDVKEQMLEKKKALEKKYAEIEVKSKMTSIKFEPEPVNNDWDQNNDPIRVTFGPHEEKLSINVVYGGEHFIEKGDGTPIRQQPIDLVGTSEFKIKFDDSEIFTRVIATRKVCKEKTLNAINVKGYHDAEEIYSNRWLTEQGARLSIPQEVNRLQFEYEGNCGCMSTVLSRVEKASGEQDGEVPESSYDAVGWGLEKYNFFTTALDGEATLYVIHISKPSRKPGKPDVPELRNDRRNRHISVTSQLHQNFWNSPTGPSLMKIQMMIDGEVHDEVFTSGDHDEGNFSFTIENVELEHDYKFRVLFVNEEGDGVYSPWTGGTIWHAPPPVPEIREIRAMDESVLVEFGFSGTTARIPVTQFELSYQQDGGEEHVLPRFDGTQSAYVVPNLKNGVEYRFKIRAFNEDQQSDFCGASVGTPTPPKLKLKSLKIAYQLRTGAEDSTEWKRSSGDDLKDFFVRNSFPVDAERIKVSAVGESDASLDRWLLDYSTDNSEWRPLEFGEHGMTVILNKEDEDSTTIALAIKREVGRPEKPTFDELKTVSRNEQVTLFWEVPEQNGKQLRPSDGYEIAVTGPDTQRNVQVSGLSTQFTIEELENDEPYQFQIKAQNSEGWGDLSDVITASPDGRPDAPTNVKLTSQNQMILVNWQKADGNGEDLTKYSVLVYETDNEEDTKKLYDHMVAPENEGNEEEYLVKNLKNGVKYSVDIASHSGLGESRERSTTVSAIPATTPGKCDFSASAEDGYVSLTLQQPPLEEESQSGGSSVTHYQVVVNEKLPNGVKKQVEIPGKIEITDPKMVVDIGKDILENGKVYELDIRAVNGVGESKEANTVIVKPVSSDTSAVEITVEYTSDDEKTLTETWTIDEEQITGHLFTLKETKEATITVKTRCDRAHVLVNGEHSEKKSEVVPLKAGKVNDVGITVIAENKKDRHDYTCRIHTEDDEGDVKWWVWLAVALGLSGIVLTAFFVYSFCFLPRSRANASSMSEVKHSRVE